MRHVSNQNWSEESRDLGTLEPAILIFLSALAVGFIAGYQIGFPELLEFIVGAS